MIEHCSWSRSKPLNHSKSVPERLFWKCYFWKNQQMTTKAWKITKHARSSKELDFDKHKPHGFVHTSTENSKTPLGISMIPVSPMWPAKLIQGLALVVEQPNFKLGKINTLYGTTVIKQKYKLDMSNSLNLHQASR